MKFKMVFMKFKDKLHLEEEDRETTFSPTNSLKEHLNAE